MNKSLSLVFLLLFISSCEWLQEDAPLTVDDPLVVAAAQTRLERYMSIKIASCRENMLEQAEMKVDSIISELIEDYRQDTTYFPPIPKRPEFPEKLMPDSRLKLQPIIDSIPSKIGPKSQQDSIKSSIDSSPKN
jgi:hypothetical protein